MRTQVLDADTAHLWFPEVWEMERSGAAGLVNDIHKLREKLATGLLAPEFRVVAETDGRFQGRMAARYKEGVIAFWNPVFAANTPPDVMRHGMAMMIQELVGARDRAGLSQFVIEDRTGDDMPNMDLWLPALRDAGFRETVAYQTHVLRLVDWISPASPVAGLLFREIDDAGEAELVSLHRRVKSVTLQKRGAQQRSAEEDIADMKRTALGRHAPTWIVADLAGAPVGYALANLTTEDQFPGTWAWLIGIGVVPDQRGKGLAAALVSEVCARLKTVGAQGILSAIEEGNAPSLRLHASLGFQPLPDRHYIFQLAAPALAPGLFPG